MVFKRIFKPGKKKKHDSESQGSSSRADTPSPNASIRSSSPPPVQPVAVSALVFQPFVALPTSPVPRQTDPAVTEIDTWPNLTAFLGLLQRTALFSPLAAAIDELSWFLRAHESVSTTRKEYKQLRTHLDGVFKDLCTHFTDNAPPSMTTSMLNLSESIQAEVRQAYGTQDRNVISRYLQAEQDLDRLTGCYRRIQGHLERLTVNASLNIWRIADKQATEAQLAKLSPSMSACYDSAEANVVQRRECTANTREKVLSDLNAWKDNPTGEQVCWMNGMAGTGKTTIATSMCSTLQRHYQLGASFFCTRSIPSCRDVKLILPTIAYQLARFSGPFRGALLKVLDEDPDVHTKVPGVQFRRMILEPLRTVVHSLPAGMVVVIDALDECDDDNGVQYILEVLLEHASELPIKFLVSSRPERHIRERIQKSSLKTKLVLHELDEKMVKEDIETYLRIELASMSVSVSSSEMAQLVGRAGVLFIYAATVIRYIKQRNSLERLQTVLQVPTSGQGPSNQTKDIDLLYELTLGSALNSPDLERVEKEQMELVLHTVICAQEPLTVDSLSGLLQLRTDQVVAALAPLWSVLHMSETNTAHRVSTLHASFPDYMLDSTRSGQFACDPTLHNSKLAELCIRRIERNQHQSNICSLKSTYTFDEEVTGIEDKVKEVVPLDLLYACQYWAVHLSLGVMSDKLAGSLDNFLSKRLLLWMEVLNLAKQIDKGVELMQKAICWLKAGERFESTLLLARDARRFVTVFATSPVSRSTPHLYVSMLASWPDHQPISQHYSRHASGLVQIKGLQTAERQVGLLSVVPAGSQVNCVAYSAKGGFFAAGTSNNRVLIWDAASCRMTIDPIKTHTDKVRAIAISPDGTRICSGSEDETLCIWDPQNGQQVAGPLKGHTDWIYSVDYSPNGRWLASCSNDGTVCVWSTGNWEKTAKLAVGGKDRVFSVAFSPDGSIVAAGVESTIHLWDPSTEQKIGNPFEGHTDLIYTLVFLPDGQHLVSGSDDRTIRIWNIHTRQIAFGPFQDHLGSVDSLTVSPDGSLLISASSDNTMRIWDTATWHTRAVIHHTGVVKSVTFSPDGSQLVSGSVDRNMRVWDVEDILDGQHIRDRSDGHSGWVRSVAFSPCGSYIVSGSSDMTVCMWDSQSGRLLHPPLKGHDDYFLSVGVSADSSQIFSVSKDRMVHVWDRQSGGLEYTIGPIETDGQDDAYYQEFWPAGFIFGGKRVVCGSKSGRIYMWEDSKLIYSREGHKDRVEAIAFSPDGESFVSGSEDGEVMIWEASSGDRMFDPCQGHSGGVDSVAFSPDGLTFASGSQDLTIRIWSKSTGSQVGEAFTGHTDTVRSVAFSPRGNHLVSGSQDWTVRMWDVANGQPMAIFKGHAGFVLSVAFSPDGTRVVSGSSDKTIRLWNTLPEAGDSTPGDDRSEEPTKELANAINNNLTPEWEIDGDGWVRDRQDRLLVWVPPDLRSTLLTPRNTAVISSQGCIELDFSDARIGDAWETCYQPL